MSTIETRSPAVRRAARSRQPRLSFPKPRSISATSEESRRVRAAAPDAPTRMEVDAAVRGLIEDEPAAALGRRVLRALDRQGPLTSAEIPRTWPITRDHIRALLRQLVADGLVTVAAGDGCRGYRLTALGRRCLEEIDWSEAIALESDTAS